MVRMILPLAAFAAAVAVAGCNETAGGAGPMAAAPAAFGLPPDASCSGEINRYQTIVRADHDTGNVGDGVYNQIQSELARAVAACSSGRSGEAHTLVADSKARHGYRA